MSFRTRVVSSIMWTLAGGGAQILLKLIVVAVLARLLSPDEFGVVAGAMLVIYILELVGSLGVGLSIVQRKSLNPEHIVMAHAIALGSSVILAVGLFVFADSIARLWGLDEIAAVLPVMGVMLIIRGLGLPPKFRLERELEFRLVALAQVAAYTVGFGFVGLFMAINGFGLWALVVAMLVEATVHTLICLFLRMPPRAGPLKLQNFMDLTRFGVSASGAYVLSQLSLKIDEYIISLSGNTYLLGIYTRAKTTGFMPINRITAAASSVLFAAFSTIQDEKTRVGRGLRRTLVFYSMIIMPGVAVLAILGPEVIRVLLGPQWTAAIVPFQILACALFLRGLTRFSNVVINSFGRSGILVVQQAIFAIIMLISCLIGSAYGLEGIAFGVLAATLLQTGLTFMISLRLIGWRISPFIFPVAQAVVVGSICFLAGTGTVIAARYFDLSSILVIGAAGFGLGIGGLIVLLLCPMRLIGSDGIWIFDVIGKTALSKLPILKPIGEPLLHRFDTDPSDIKT